MLRVFGYYRRLAAALFFSNSFREMFSSSSESHLPRKLCAREDAGCYLVARRVSTLPSSKIIRFDPGASLLISKLQFLRTRSDFVRSGRFRQQRFHRCSRLGAALLLKLINPIGDSLDHFARRFARAMRFCRSRFRTTLALLDNLDSLLFRHC